MDLDDNYAETIAVTMRVRRAVGSKAKSGYLNFDGLRHISPSAALLLASELDRWNESIRGRLKARHSNWDPGVKRLLCQMGLFRLLGMAEPLDVRNPTNTTFLPFIRGDLVVNQQNPGELAKDLRIAIERVAGVEINRRLLYKALSEAGTNVSQHAYQRGDRIRRWWLSGAFERSANKVTVTFCDHGLTIPRTLPAAHFFERIRESFKFWDDAEKLRAAMQAGRSQTQAPERGKGLMNLIEIVADHRDNQLRIFSRRGVLTVKIDGNGALDFRSELVRTPFGGTLIEWQFVPIVGEEP